MPRRIAAGNWKMNGSQVMLDQIGTIARAARELRAVTTVICPPALLIHRAARTPGVTIGAQDCHSHPHGAHTGDISAEMHAEAGARWIIVGHSERRTDHGETDTMVAAKTGAAWRAGLTAIVCIGETRDQYEAGRTLAVLERQLTGSLPPGASAGNTVIAYEPVWAIGTGLTPTPTGIETAHRAIREYLGRRADIDIPVLYGGSVKPDNAAAIFAIDNVDGALVGGASLTAGSFMPIMHALAENAREDRKSP